jgi:hypothetical protein
MAGDVILQPEEILVGLGDAAAVFAGFSGIVAVLGARSVTELSPLSRFRFSNLLVISVSTCLLAFAPLVLGAFSLASSLIWAWSSATLALFALLFLIAANTRQRRVRAAEVAAGRAAGRTWMAVFSICVLVGVCLSQCVNAIAWPLSRGAALYVAGLFGLLILSGLQFILLALDSTPVEK